MTFQDRWFQDEGVSAGFNSLEKGNYPVVAMPTGSGKSVVLCKLADEILSKNPIGGVLVLTHVKEIIEQNTDSLERHFEGYPVNVYSAGLGRREVGLITVAGIQSAYHHPELFERFRYVIIDECHLINHKEQGMYRDFLSLIEARCIGLTATAFRLGHGYIYKGETTLFDDLAYDCTTGEKYNRLVDEGFISQMFSKKTLLLMDTKGIGTIAGDFNEKQLAERFNIDNITEAAILETLHFGKKYKKWLCFAIDISHAENIAERFNEHGIPAKAVHSRMTEDRNKILNDYRKGVYRVLVNVNVLSTGLDITTIDLIIHLRPTKSPSFHVQTNGRGGRVEYAPGFDLDTIQGRLDAIESGPKQHCLVLDFAGNTKECGPLNDPLVREKGEKKGEAITKTCPECDMINHGAVRECINCGFEFKMKEKESRIEFTASSEEIIKDTRKDLKAWVNVSGVRYDRHPGRNNKPSTMRVTYKCGLLSFKEYIALDHFGNARYQAKNWVFQRWIGPRNERPTTTSELIAKSDGLSIPKKILVDSNGKYTRILDSEF